MLQDVLAKNFEAFAARRVLLDGLMKRYGAGVTKACAVVMISPSLYRLRIVPTRQWRAGHANPRDSAYAGS